MKRNDCLISCAILFVALITRLWGLGNTGLVNDEPLSLQAASQPLSHILTNTSDVHPPLYFAFLHIWMRFFGESNVSLRLLSVLFGLLAVGLTGWIGRRIGGKSLAWLSMCLVAIMPMPLVYSQVARGYTMFLVFSLASFGYLMAWEESKQFRWAAGYAVSTVAMCYTHHYGVFNIIAQQLYMVCRVRRHRVSLRNWFVLSAVVWLVLIPWLNICATQSSRLQKGYWIARPDIWTILTTFRMYVTVQLEREFMWWFVALAGLGLLEIQQRRGTWSSRNWLRSLRSYHWEVRLPCRASDGLLLLWLSCPIVIPFVWSQISTPIFLYRYTIAAAPAFYLLIGRGILGIPNGGIRFIILLIIALISIASLTAYYASSI